MPSYFLFNISKLQFIYYMCSRAQLSNSNCKADFLFQLKMYYTRNYSSVEYSTKEEFMEEYYHLLLKSPLFRGIKEEDLAGLLKDLKAEIVGFGDDEQVLDRDKQARSLGLVLEGGIQLSRLDYRGNRSLLTKIGPGGIFGEAVACVHVDKLPVDVRSIGESRVLKVDTDIIISPTSSTYPHRKTIVYNLIQILARKNLLLNEKIEVVSKRTTREKLMTFLKSQANQAQSSNFTIPFNRQELADYLEVNRSGLSAQISELREEGVLKSDRNEFTLL